MVLQLDDGSYLHTAYAISNVAEELLEDEWSTTERGVGMDYVGQYVDDSPIDSTDATDYEWEELYDLDVDDTDDDDEMPVADEQVQIGAIEEQLNILQQDSEELFDAIGTQADNVRSANDISSSALDIANATNQHFWTDDNGVHVSNEDGNPEGERNTLWNSLGMLFRKGSNYLLNILVGGADGTGDKGVAIYDGTGTSDSHLLARFLDSEISFLEDGEKIFSVERASINPYCSQTKFINWTIDYDTAFFTVVTDATLESVQSLSLKIQYGQTGTSGDRHNTTVILTEDSPSATIYDSSNVVSMVVDASNNVVRVTVTSSSRWIYVGDVTCIYATTSINGAKVVGGAFADLTDAPLFAIGNGTSEQNRSNAMSLDFDGNLKVANLQGTQTGVYTNDARLGNIRILTGNIVCTHMSSVGTQDFEVTFDRPFLYNPNIQLQSLNVFGNYIADISVASPSPTGFKVRIYSRETASHTYNVNWLAIGELT